MSRKSYSPSKGGLRLPLEGNNIDLVTVISPDNQYQTGQHFADLVLEINKRKEQIRSVTIINADYLARHYNEDKKDITSDEEKKDITTIPEESVHITCWFEITQSKIYRRLYNKICEKFTGHSTNADDIKSTKECVVSPTTEDWDPQYSE